MNTLSNIGEVKWKLKITRKNLIPKMSNTSSLYAITCDDDCPKLIHFWLFDSWFAAMWSIIKGRVFSST